MRTAPKTVLIAAAIAVVAGLTGCSGGGQSVAEACKVVQEQGMAISSKAQDAMASTATDPKAAADALNDMQDEFDKLGEKITNDEVKPVYNDFVKAYGQLTEVIGKIAEDPESASDSVSEMTDISTKLTDAGKALDKVCS